MLLKGHGEDTRHQTSQKAAKQRFSIPGKGETPVITGNCATCTPVRIDGTKSLDVVHSDWVNKDRGTGKKRSGWIYKRQGQGYREEERWLDL